ncbi:MAG: MFS transporter [Ktedonobacteraceae bacterium]|nr:MFS transporter [Ktedonobacteraceae bacterium]MBO0792070.1 MFS transporter [Ktedonobacteraceae bacterium]
MTPSLWRTRTFPLIWASLWISGIGDWVLSIAMPLYLFASSSSSLLIGGWLLALTIPRIVISLFAGSFVDQGWTQHALVLAYAGRGIAVALLPFISLPSGLPLFYTCGAVLGALGALGDVATGVWLPQVVGESRITEASGWGGVSWELTRLFAPPLGGFLYVWSGFAAVTWLDSVTFFLAIAGLVGVMTMAPLQKMNQGQERKKWHKGLIVISHTPSLRSLAMLTLGAGMAEGVIGVIGVPWLVTVLHGGAVERGWLATAQGIGGLLGGWWAARSPKGERMGWTFLAFGCLSLALTWGVTFPMPSSLRWSFALLIKGVSGIPLVIGTVRLRAALIRWTEASVRGRVLGACVLLEQGGMAMGQVVGSLSAELWGVLPALSLQGGIYLLLRWCSPPHMDNERSNEHGSSF